MKSKLCFEGLMLLFFLLAGCKNKTYNGTCTLSGYVRDYKTTRLALYEITPSQNYLVSAIQINRSGKFELTFKAREKSVYGITNGSGFIYFINDAPELYLETSESELENYIVEGSPQSEQLRQLVVTYKKLATELELAEKLLISKMVKRSAKFGSDPVMLDLENKADKRAIELRNYIVNYMDTVQDKLLAVAASSLLMIQEDFNYLSIFSKKLEGTNVNQRQKADLKTELDKARRSFQSIAPLEVVRGLGLDGKPAIIDSLKGKYVLVNIWSTWCFLSRTQIPFIKKAYRKFEANTNIKFINVAIDDDVAGWKKFLKKEDYEIRYQLCDSLGKDAAILKRFGLDYIPANFLLDRNGNIITSNLKDEYLILTIDSVLRTGSAN